MQRFPPRVVCIASVGCFMVVVLFISLFCRSGEGVRLVGSGRGEGYQGEGLNSSRCFCVLLCSEIGIAIYAFFCVLCCAVCTMDMQCVEEAAIDCTLDHICDEAR